MREEEGNLIVEGDLNRGTRRNGNGGRKGREM